MELMLVVHIVVALASLACTTWLFFTPAKLMLHISYGLTAATLASGTYIVWQTQAHLVSACTTGMLYLGITALGIVSARRKLAVNLATGSVRNRER